MILKFLKSLAKIIIANGLKKNKPKYLEVKLKFEDFLEAFHKEAVKFDESLGGLNPRKLGFRIYRDVRFSKDKRPYKVNMGAGMSAHGKMEQEPGYYIHIEPGKSFIAGGIYMPDNENLAKIRQEIDYNTKDIQKILNDKKFKKLFPALGDFDKLKTAPKGYAKDHPNIDLLRYKSYIVSHNFTDAEVIQKDFAKKAAAACRIVLPLNTF